ncbi:MAG: hypothetical protein ACXQT3_02975 [Methermicoccaceae archaeon]
MTPTCFHLRKYPAGGVLTPSQTRRLDRWVADHPSLVRCYHCITHDRSGVGGRSGGVETTFYPLVFVRGVRYYAIPTYDREAWELVPLPYPIAERVAELEKQGIPERDAKVLALYEQGYTFPNIAHPELGLGIDEHEAKRIVRSYDLTRLEG